MFREKRIYTVLLVGIFFLGFFLRFYKLSEFPVGFHIDEASKGYTAYSILKTGKDENNKAWPLYIDIFGDNSPAGYHYLTIPSVAFFGLTEFAVRSPGALFGSLTIPAIFLFVFTIFKNKKISTLSALLLAISPWHINLSRASNESIVSLFFILVSFTLIIQSLRKQSVKVLLAGSLLLIPSFLLYQTPRGFVPVIFLVFIFLFFKLWKIKVSKKYFSAFILSFVFILLIDLFLIFKVTGGTGRFNQVSIFNHQESQLLLMEQIGEDGVTHTNPTITRIFHNKLINYSFTYLSNYFEYFSFNFLFLKNLPEWYFIPSMGVLYLAELPFIFIGAVSLIINKNKFFKIPLIWLVIGPSIAAVTADSYNLQRTSVMFPMFEVLAAVGLYYSFYYLKKKHLFFFFVCIAFAFNFAFFMHQYFVHTKVHRTWYRNNGYKEMVLALNRSYKSYDKIILSTSMPGLYPLINFYSKYDPAIYQKEGSSKDKNNSGFGKYYFVPEDCPSYDEKSNYPVADRMIFVNRGTCEPDFIHQETIISREDGTIAFRVVYADTIKNNSY